MLRSTIGILGLIAAMLVATGQTWADSASSSSDASEFPGGAATSTASVDNANAFSASSGNLPFEREFDFKIGNAIFRKLWVSAPASTKTSDGLGPLFNARSCQGCHVKDGRGRPPSGEEDAVSMFLRLSVPPLTEGQKRSIAEHRANVIPEPTYGGQLQNFAIQGLDSEGRMQITYEEIAVTFPDGETASLRRPRYAVTDLAFGPLHPDTMLSPRVAPPMIGLGLLESIPEADILALADSEDTDGDGVSGRPSQVWSIRDGAVRLGRFGWKAGNATIEQQSAEAFAGDIGISSSLVPHPWGECTASQTACREAPSGAPKSAPTIEIADDLLALVTFYSSNLAVPRRRNATGADVVQGGKVFTTIGCARCHHPSFTTGVRTDQPHLGGQTIWPYTDLLLHDMGEGLADNRPEGVADGREWRTAPLWGIGLTEVVSGHSFLLHDGRARSIEEAILWHGGEAQSITDTYKALSKQERDALVAFVKSL
jgi:CxxC motif-containing protein (DUF1111 family)